MPDGAMAAHLVLAQIIEVRILVGQYASASLEAEASIFVAQMEPKNDPGSPEWL